MATVHATVEACIESTSGLSPDSTPGSAGSHYRRRRSSTNVMDKSWHEIWNQNFKPKPVRHDSGAVLLLQWDDAIDDLKVGQEVAELHDVFKNHYGFEVKRIKIDLNARDLQLRLQIRILDFLDNYDEQNALLIVYYAGHGWDKDGQLRLLASTSLSSNASESLAQSVAWDVAEQNLKGRKSDIFVIFDCCYAGSLQGRDGMRPFEFLAACGSKETAASPGDHSFTRALIEVLRELKDEKRSFSSKELKDRIEKSGVLRGHQHPQLMPRFGQYEERIWIAPLNCASEIADTGVYQELEHGFMDLRFHFPKVVTIDDVIATAQGLSKAINSPRTEPGGLTARTVLLRDVSSHKNYVEPFAQVWLENYRDKTLQSPLEIPSTVATSTFDSNEGPRVDLNTPYRHGSASDDETTRLSLEISDTTRLLPPEWPARANVAASFASTRTQFEEEYNQGIRHHLRGLMRSIIEKIRGIFRSIGRKSRRKIRITLEPADEPLDFP